MKHTNAPINIHEFGSSGDAQEFIRDQYDKTQHQNGR